MKTKIENILTVFMILATIGIGAHFLMDSSPILDVNAIHSEQARQNSSFETLPLLKGYNSDYVSFRDALIERYSGNLIPDFNQCLQNGKSVFLFFFIEGCSSCHRQKPIIDMLKMEYKETVEFFYIDGMENPILPESFHVAIYPSMYYIFDVKEDGYSYDEFKGFTGEHELRMGILSALTLKRNVHQLSSEMARETQEKTIKEDKQQKTIVHTDVLERDKEEAEFLGQLKEEKSSGDMRSVQHVEEELAHLRNQEIEFIPSLIGLPYDDVVVTDVSRANKDKEGKGTGDDVLVTGFKSLGWNASMVSDGQGNLYIAVEDAFASYPSISLYKSMDNGESWHWFFDLYHPTEKVKSPSLAVGEGGGQQGWLFLAFSVDEHQIQVWRFKLDTLSVVELVVSVQNMLGVSSPKIVTDSLEYPFNWYPYLIYNYRNIDNWELRCTRSLDHGGNWTAPTSIYQYQGFPETLYDASDAHPDIDFGGGRLYVACDDYSDAAGSNVDVFVISSDDYGNSWSSPTRLTDSSDAEYDPAVAAVKNHYSNKTAVVSYTRLWSGFERDVWYASTQDGGITWTTGYPLAWSNDDESSPDMATSFEGGIIHAAYWHDHDIDYQVTHFDTLNQWKEAGPINEMHAASEIYPKPSITVNPRKPLMEQACVVWTDSRAVGPLNTYFDIPAYSICYSCSECETQLDNPVYTLVFLGADIVNDTSIECIYNRGNISGKIFDGQGHRIDGLSSNTYLYSVYGICVESATNFTLRNCVFSDWDYSVFLKNSRENTLLNNVVTSETLNPWNYSMGIYFLNSSQNILRGNIVHSRRVGLNLFDSGENIIENNDFTNNFGYSLYDDGENGCNFVVNNIGGDDGKDIRYEHDATGLTIMDGTYASLILCRVHDSTITNVTIDNQDSLSDGILLVSSEHNLIQRCNLTHDQEGIQLYRSHDNRIINTSMVSNEFAVTLGYSNGNVIENNLMQENYMGTYFFYSGENSFRDNKVVRNADYGVNVDSSPSTQLIGNTIVQNGRSGWSGFGLGISGSSQCVVGENLLESNINGGIAVIFSSDNQILHNVMYNNSDYGISLLHSSNNLILNNGLDSHENGIKLYFQTKDNEIHANQIVNNGVGINLSYAYNNSFHENIVCSSEEADFYLKNSSGNEGDENSCDTPDGWNDQGTTGCTYSCEEPSPPEIFNATPPHMAEGIPRPPPVIGFNVTGIDLFITFRWLNHASVPPFWEESTLFSESDTRFEFYPSGLPTTQWIWGNTTYLWGVNVTDGTCWNNKTFTFTTGGSRYDVNNDDKVNFIDAGIVWVHRKTNALYDGLYDVNQDGTVNFIDAGRTWINRD